MDDIEGELLDCLSQLRLMMREVVDEADRFGTSAYSMKNTQGDLVMQPLVVAKAQVLMALGPIRAQREAFEKLEVAKKNFMEKFNQYGGESTT